MGTIETNGETENKEYVIAYFRNYETKRRELECDDGSGWYEENTYFAKITTEIFNKGKSAKDIFGEEDGYADEGGSWSRGIILITTDSGEILYDINEYQNIGTSDNPDMKWFMQQDYEKEAKRMIDNYLEYEENKEIIN